MRRGFRTTPALSDTALRIERRGHVVILENEDAPRNRMHLKGLPEPVQACGVSWRE